MLGSRIIPIDSSGVIESTDAIPTSGWDRSRFIRFASRRSTDYAMAPCLVFVSCTVVIIETRGSLIGRFRQIVVHATRVVQAALEYLTLVPVLPAFRVR